MRRMDSRFVVTAAARAAVEVLEGRTMLAGVAGSDSFAGAEEILTPAGSVPMPLVADNSAATSESGEPQHGGTTSAGKTLWYKWTAPSSGTAHLAWQAPFALMAAVYGSGAATPALSDLQRVDDGAAGSCAYFGVTAGQTYWIAFDGQANAGSLGDAGQFTFVLNAPLASQGVWPALRWDEVQELTGSSLTLAGYSGFGIEAGEPDLGGRVQDSVWYSWTPDQSGRASFTRVDSDGSMYVTAYTGSSLDNLVPVAGNYDGQNGPADTFTFDAVAGELYRIQVGGSGEWSGRWAVNLDVTNDSPTGYALSANTVEENALAGTRVGVLSAVDADAGDTHTFEILPGADAGLFQIVGGELRTAGRFDFETRSSYAITIRVTDAAGATYEAPTTISISDVTVPQTLQINGNAFANTIGVQLVDGRYQISEDGVISTVDAAEVAVISVVAGDGDDTVTIGAGVGPVSILGQGGNDTIIGGDHADTIYGGDGDDSISGGGGDDVLYGNFGSDTLDGGGENDSLMGGLGMDLLSGGIGNDTMMGGDQSDTLHGGDGDDLLDGKGKADFLWGGAGNDMLYGGAGADQLIGDDGDDVIYSHDAYVLGGVAGAFSDTINGGAGNDSLLHDDLDLWGGIEVYL